MNVTLKHGPQFTENKSGDGKRNIERAFVMLKIHGCATHRCVTKKEIHIVTRTVTVINNQTD